MRPTISSIRATERTDGIDSYTANKSNKSKRIEFPFIHVLGMTLNCTWLGFGVKKSWGQVSWATLGQGAVPTSLPYQGYDVTPLLPCGLPVLGKATGVNPNRESGAVGAQAVSKFVVPLDQPAARRGRACCLDNSSSSIHPAQAM